MLGYLSQKGRISFANKSIVCFFSLVILLGSYTQVSAFLDNFDSGKLGEAWQKSPAGLDASWSIDKGVLIFNGAGGHSQMMTGEADWKDYAVECDIRLTSPNEWPGGIRTYVDTQTGGHYAVWFYPVQKKIILYSGTAWDINTGIVKLGEYASFEPKLDEFFYVKVIHKSKHIEVWFGDKKDKIEKIIEADNDTFKSGLFACDGWDKPIHFDNILIKGAGIPLSQGEAAVNHSGKLTISWGKIKRDE